MNGFVSSVKQLSKRRFFKFGVPFVSLIILGSFGLREFAGLRYQFRTTSRVREEADKIGIEMKDRKEVTLEAEYEKVKKMDIDNWENIRGPRPWEENIQKR